MTTSSSKPGPKLLFVDPESEYLASLKKDRKAQIIAPVIAETGAHAIEILANTALELSAVFVSQDIKNPDCLSVVRRAKQLRPTVPILLTYTGEACNIDPSILDKVGYCETIRRDFTYGQVARKYFAPELLFETADAIERSAYDENPVGHEAELAPDDFIPIRADSFISGKKSVFDLFVKVGATKLVKILKAGDDFTADRVNSYRNKGVEHFYIHKSAQQDYLAYSHKLTAAIVQHPSIQAEVKINHTLSEGESIHSFLKLAPKLEPEHLRFAESYIRQVEALIQELGLEKQNALVASILRNPEMKEHIVGASIMAGLFAQQLGFESKKSASLIGIGCLLHDIGLPPELQGVELLAEEKMDSTQRRAWLEHPMKGARIASEIPGINPVVSEIVASHHLRRNGTGFPETLATTKIAIPTEIVGAADEIVRLFINNQNLPVEALHHKLLIHILPTFSGTVSEAIKTVLKIEEE